MSFDDILIRVCKYWKYLLGQTSVFDYRSRLYSTNYRCPDVPERRNRISCLTVYRWNMIIEISGAISQASPADLQRRSLFREHLSGVPSWSVDWRATRIEPGKIAKAEFLTGDYNRTDERRIRSRFVERTDPHLTLVATIETETLAFVVGINDRWNCQGRFLPYPSDNTMKINIANYLIESLIIILVTREDRSISFDKTTIRSFIIIRVTSMRVINLHG